MRALDRLKTGNSRAPALSTRLPRIIRDAWVLASVSYNAPKVRSAFIFLALLAEDDTARLLHEISREFRKYPADQAAKDLMQVVAGSPEDEPNATQSGAATLTLAQSQSSMARIFICYRREDSKSFAESLFDRVIAGMAGAQVFWDTDTLPPGALIRQSIENTIAQCGVLIALIGKKWLKPDGAGRRRIDDENDYVRLEIAAALRQKKVVIPCLVEGARMPTADQLPAELQELLIRNAVSVSRERRRQDTERLIEWLERLRREHA